jgi:hypothetical protein
LLGGIIDFFHFETLNTISLANSPTLGLIRYTPVSNTFFNASPEVSTITFEFDFVAKLQSPDKNLLAIHLLDTTTINSDSTPLKALMILSFQHLKLKFRKIKTVLGVSIVINKAFPCPVFSFNRMKWN